MGKTKTVCCIFLRISISIRLFLFCFAFPITLTTSKGFIIHVWMSTEECFYKCIGLLDFVELKTKISSTFLLSHFNLLIILFLWYFSHIPLLPIWSSTGCLLYFCYTQLIKPNKKMTGRIYLLSRYSVNISNIKQEENSPRVEGQEGRGTGCYYFTSALRARLAQLWTAPSAQRPPSSACIVVIWKCPKYFYSYQNYGRTSE